MDRDTRLVLDALHAQGGPALHELSTGDARAALKALSARLDIERVPVAQVTEHTVLAGGVPPLRVRVYSDVGPTPNQAARPLLMQLHGGGFAFGDLDTHDHLCRYHAVHAGVIVVSVEYRLAPENPFPAAVEDCYAALEWVARNAASLGGDAHRIAITGDSAGGNLAITTALTAIRRTGPRVWRLIPVYPVVDMRPDPALYSSRAEFGGGEYFLSQKDFEWMVGLYAPEGTDLADPGLSPILAPNIGALPPTFLIVAGCDILRDEELAFADRLRRAGGNVHCRCFDGTIHGFISLAGAIALGREALDYICQYLRTEMQGPP